MTQVFTLTIEGTQSTGCGDSAEMPSGDAPAGTANLTANTRARTAVRTPAAAHGARGRYGGGAGPPQRRALASSLSLARLSLISLSAVCIRVRYGTCDGFVSLL
jgi:hypothetical protein